MLLVLGLALAMVYACPRLTTFCAGLGLLFFLPFGVVEALDGIFGPGRRHVTLRVQMGLIFVLALALGLPGTLLYYLGMSLLYVAALAACSTVEGMAKRILNGSNRAASESLDDPRSWDPKRLFLSLLRPLALCSHAAEIELTRAVWIAAIHTVTIIGLWPLLREFGFEVIDRFRQSSDLFTWPIEMWQLPVSLSTLEYWRHAALWEAWSLSRWWLLFGSLAFGCYTAGRKLAPGAEHDGWRQLRRVLLFAPWLVVLETSYLAGLWAADPTAVPEPSALYALDWPLENWQLRVWLIRGLLPTAVAGLAFFRMVVGWRGRRCLCAVVVFVPVALALSVLWTLGYARWILPLG